MLQIGKFLSISNKLMRKIHEEVIPAGEDNDASVNFLQEESIASYIHNASSLVKIYGVDGKFIKI